MKRKIVNGITCLSTRTGVEVSISRAPRGQIFVLAIIPSARESTEGTPTFSYLRSLCPPTKLHCLAIVFELVEFHSQCHTNSQTPFQKKKKKRNDWYNRGNGVSRNTTLTTLCITRAVLYFRERVRVRFVGEDDLSQHIIPLITSNLHAACVSRRRRESIFPPSFRRRVHALRVTIYREGLKRRRAKRKSFEHRRPLLCLN